MSMHCPIAGMAGRETAPTALTNQRKPCSATEPSNPKEESAMAFKEAPRRQTTRVRANPPDLVKKHTMALERLRAPQGALVLSRTSSAPVP